MRYAYSFIQDFYVLEYPELCNVIAITKDGKFLMERQYRHAQVITIDEVTIYVK